MEDKKPQSTTACPTLRQTQSVNQYTKVKPQPLIVSSLEAVTLRPSTRQRRRQSTWARYSYNPNVIVVDRNTDNSSHNVVSSPINGYMNLNTKQESKVSQLIKTFTLNTSLSSNNSNNGYHLQQDDNMHTILEYRAGRLHQLGTMAQCNLSATSAMDKSAVPLNNSSKITCQVKNSNHVISPETVIYHSGKSIDVPNKTRPKTTTSTSIINNNNNKTAVAANEFMIKVAKGDLTTSICIHPLPPPNDQRCDQVTNNNRINSTKDIRSEPNVSPRKPPKVMQIGMENSLNSTHMNLKTFHSNNSSDTTLKCDLIPLEFENEVEVSKSLFCKTDNSQLNPENNNFKAHRSRDTSSGHICHRIQSTSSLSSVPESQMHQDLPSGTGHPQSLASTEIKFNYNSQSEKLSDKECNYNSAFNLKDHFEKVLPNQANVSSEVNRDCVSTKDKTKASFSNISFHEIQEPQRGYSAKYPNSGDDCDGDDVDSGFFLQENDCETTDYQDAVANSEALFGGQRNYLLPEKLICGHTGTVRGMKNRVRAGIATFLQTSDGNKVRLRLLATIDIFLIFKPH